MEQEDRMPLYRLNPRADDAPCDAQNSAHVIPGAAYVRGRDAKWEKKDNLKAACWFQTAAFGGIAQAQAMLASQLYNGEGVATNYDQAFAWAQKSTAQGNLLGEWILANLYDQGKGVPADKRKAAALRELIAEQRNNAIWSNLDARTPSGLTLRQAIGVGLAINGAIMKELDDDGLRFDCSNGHRSACEALRNGPH
jgi:TPR repeat protein